jgi:hypothetical protein
MIFKRNWPIYGQYTVIKPESQIYILMFFERINPNMVIFNTLQTYKVHCIFMNIEM